MWQLRKLAAAVLCLVFQLNLKNNNQRSENIKQIQHVPLTICTTSATTKIRNRKEIKTYSCCTFASTIYIKPTKPGNIHRRNYFHALHL